MNRRANRRIQAQPQPGQVNQHEPDHGRSNPHDARRLISRPERERGQRGELDRDEPIVARQKFEDLRHLAHGALLR